jgi:hypothetical protein
MTPITIPAQNLLLGIALITPAQARSSHSYSGRSTHEFRTFSCKSSSCVAKHPGGTWVHPLTGRKR